MRIGWIGFHEEGVLALEAVVGAGHDVVGVMTLRPDRAARRSAAVDYTLVCNRLGVPIHYVNNINDTAAVEQLQAMELDLGIVLGWSQILHRDALQTARIGMVGAHASMLPHNRGSAPVNWAIIRGETLAGNSLMWLSEGVDEGQVIDQRGFEITRYDTCASVYKHVAATNREMVLDLLARLQAGQRPGRPQPATSQPILPRRRPADGLIDWQQSAAAIYNFIRALTRPYPGAFSFLDGHRLHIWQAALLPTPIGRQHEPGTVIGAAVSPIPSACGQVVACQESCLLILEVQREDNTVLNGQALGEQPWQGRVWNNAATKQQEGRHAA